MLTDSHIHAWMMLPRPFTGEELIQLVEKAVRFNGETALVQPSPVDDTVVLGQRSADPRKNIQVIPAWCSNADRIEANAMTIAKDEIYLAVTIIHNPSTSNVNDTSAEAAEERRQINSAVAVFQRAFRDQLTLVAY